MPPKRKSAASNRKANEKANKRALKGEYRAVNQRQPWSPGASRTPWLSFGALIVTVIAIATSVGILVGSNNALISTWRFQPTVYLAIATTIANICLQFAFAEGVTITWWRSAIRGTTLGDLHRIQHYGTNFWGAASAWPHTNFIAIACILVTLSPVNGPLMQRASQVSSSGTATERTLTLHAATQVPPGYTAYLTGRQEYVSMLTEKFSPIVQAWDTQRPISMNHTGCSGICKGKLRGAGFAVNCTSQTRPFNMTYPWPATGELPDDYESQVPFARYFEIAFSYTYGLPMYAQNIAVGFKNTTDCVGQIQMRNCTLQPATVEFPITIDGSSQTISLSPGTTIFDDKIQSILTPPVDSAFDRSRFGGMYEALSDRYTSSVDVRMEPARGAESTGSGLPASQYAVMPSPWNITLRGSPNTYCNFSYSSPLMDVLNAARDLSFRTAIAAANKPSDQQNVLVTQTTSEAQYRSSYLFLVLAILATVLPTALVSITFHEYWRLGRNFSLSPIETAKAFNAPGMSCKDSNATARGLVKDIGSRQVRYGGVNSVSTTEELSEDISEEGISMNRLSESDETPRLRLQMKSPQFVLRPLRGWIFAG